MRKIEQPNEKPSKNQYQCVCCGKDKKAEEFYRSRSRLFSQTGRLVWCNDCVKAIYQEFISHFDETMAFLRFCILLDIPFIKEIVDEIDLSDSANIGKYLNRIAMSSRHKSKGFIQGDITSDLQMLKKQSEDTEGQQNFVVSYEMRRLWRNPSYQPEDYEILWEHYTQLQELHFDANDQQRNYFPILADLFLKREKAGWSENGLDEYDKLSKLYNSTYSAAGFTPKEQGTKAESTIGSIVQLCESKSFIEPWEYRKKYPQRRDEVWRQELDNLNHVNKNEGLPILKELPRYCLQVETDDIYTKDEITLSNTAVADEIDQELEE